MTEPVAPDPSNSQPEGWTGGAVDDGPDLNRLITMTGTELALGAELDRVEGIS